MDGLYICMDIYMDIYMDDIYNGWLIYIYGYIYI